MSEGGKADSSNGDRNTAALVFWAFAMGVLVTLVWTLPYPSPCEKPQAETYRYQSAPDTGRAPVAASGKRDVEQTYYGCDEKDSDWWLVKLAGVGALIAAAQGIMFFFQWRVMRAGLGDTRISAEAALEAARAAKIQADVAERTLSNLEQPHVFTNDIGWIQMDGGRRKIKFKLNNMGRSAAIIRDIQAQIFVSTTGAPEPPFLLFGQYTSWTVFNVLGGAKESEVEYSYPVPDTFLTEEIDHKGAKRIVPIVENGEAAYFICRIIYDDIFGVENASAFYWIYDVERYVFMRPERGGYCHIRENEGKK